MADEHARSPIVRLLNLMRCDNFRAQHVPQAALSQAALESASTRPVLSNASMRDRNVTVRLSSVLLSRSCVRAITHPTARKPPKGPGLPKWPVTSKKGWLEAMIPPVWSRAVMVSRTHAPKMACSSMFLSGILRAKAYPANAAAHLHATYGSVRVPS